MTTHHPALAEIAGSLVYIVRTGDTVLLREYLRGRHLPALGGDLIPADLILRALEQTPKPKELARNLAGLLGKMLSEEVEYLREPGAGLEAGRRTVLLNMLYLAVELPPNPALFDALRRLHFPLPRLQESGAFDLRGDDRLLPALCQALVYQQTDDSCEKIWLGILEQSNLKTPAQETYLLQAWRGLLWIPPTPSQARKGEVIDFGRVALGLRSLDRSAGVSGRHQILRSALSILAETYPRSDAFWAARLGPLTSEWSESLQEEAIRRWPALRGRASVAVTRERGASHQAAG